MNRPSILIHVQHLLGTGHLRRMVALAAALVARGARVTLVSGGMPVPGLALPTGLVFVQLPPARVGDARFDTLRDAAGQPVDAAWREGRCARLRDAFETATPDLLLVEHFPFGRRLLEFELLPLLAAARDRATPPLRVAAVRDVLVTRPDPARRAAMVARAQALFDRVLFLGDPALVALTDSLPEAAALGDRLVACGYVAAPPGRSAPGDDGLDEIVVSAGGGGVGGRLLACALAARPLAAARRYRWRILTAGTDLAAARAPGLVVEPNRPDFPALLRRARLSVSQAGYNTVVDVLAAGARALLVPFAENRENEQSQRAAALAARGRAAVLAETELHPVMLARAIDLAAAAPQPGAHAIRLDGAARGAEMLLGWCRP
jgi:predicted glycosyltransferase